MAAQENHIDVVRFLLEIGANQSTATEVSDSMVQFIPLVITEYQASLKWWSYTAQ